MEDINKLSKVELAKYCGISRQYLYVLIRKGYSLEEIIKKYEKRYFNNKKESKKNNEKVNNALNLINRHILNWYKGDFCLKDLEEIKKVLL